MKHCASRNDLLFATIVTASLFIVVPLALYVGNRQEFSYSFPALLLDWLPFLLCFLLISYILLSKLPEKFSNISGNFLTFIFLGVYLQGSLLIWDYGVLDGSGIAWERFSSKGWIDLGVWSGVAIIVFAFSNWLRRNRVVIAVSIIALQLASIGPGLLESIQDDSGTESSIDNLYEFSSDKNVFILLLDGFFSPVFNDLIEEKTEYQKMLSGFTYFKNTTSEFTSTVLSVPSILSGRPFDATLSMKEYFEQVFARQSLPKILSSERYRVSLGTMPHFCDLLDFENCFPFSRITSGGERSGIHQEAEDLLNLSLFRILPHHGKKALFSDGEGPIRTSRDEGEAGPKRDMHLNIAETFRQNMKVGGTKPTVKFLHVLIPHVPIRFDAECNEIPPRKLSEKGYKIQAQCALKLASGILDRFRELKIFDSSMIIITADHGVRLPYGLFDAGYAKDHNLMRFTRALPLLLVKPFNSVGDFTTSSAPAALRDISKTITESLGDVIQVPGENLFTLQPNVSRIRETRDLRLRWKMWDKGAAESTFSEDPLYQATGDAWDMHSWRRADSSTNPPQASQEESTEEE